MATTVKQTLMQLLQANPGTTPNARLRADAGNTSFSQTLERSVSAPDRSAERSQDAAAASRQSSRKPEENQPVKDKAPEARERTEAPEAKTQPSEGAAADEHTAATEDGSAQAPTNTTDQSADATDDAPAETAADGTPSGSPAESVAATPAALAANPANRAPGELEGEAELIGAERKGVAADGRAAAQADLGARGEGKDGAAARTGSTGTAERVGEAPLRAATATGREAMPGFAAQLEQRLAGGLKAAEPIQMTPTGTTGAHGALAGTVPGQAQGTPGAARAPLPTHMGVPVDNPDWPDALGNRVLWLAGRDESRAELILTPPSLGKLEISLTVSGDTTTAHFTAATPAAREALEQAMPRLREMLEQAGVTLAESNVNTASQDQPGGQDRGSGFGQRHAMGGGEGLPAAGTPAGQWMLRGEGMIDTFA